VILTENGQRELREVWECSIDLCERAMTMVREAGAADDELTRQRFLAGLAHKNTSDILGAIPGLEADSAAHLLQRCRAGVRRPWSGGCRSHPQLSKAPGLGSGHVLLRPAWYELAGIGVGPPIGARCRCSGWLG
jgi:uncharacterized phage protein gp47/JayE